MAGNCQKLKWNRRALKLTQTDFAKMVGLDVKTINKLEHDEDAWDVLPDEITDRIYAQYSSMASYQPSKEEVKEMMKPEQKSTRNEGPNCRRLRAAREKLGMSQKAFAEYVGLSVQTIYQLEREETRWGTIAQETADKIYKAFDDVISYDEKDDSPEETKPESERKTFGNWSDGLIVAEDGSVKVAEDYISEKKETTSDLVEIVEDPKALEPIPELMIKHIVGESSNLTDKDRQLLKYVEFACGQLKECTSHEDFETNIDILTRIIKKQY